MRTRVIAWLRARLPGAARAYKHPVARASTTVVAGVVAVTENPYVGLAIQAGDAAIVAIADKFLAGNPQELARRTDDRINDVKDRGRFDADVLDSAEFHGAVVQAIIASTTETQREKIDLLPKSSPARPRSIVPISSICALCSQHSSR